MAIRDNGCGSDRSEMRYPLLSCVVCVYENSPSLYLQYIFQRSVEPRRSPDCSKRGQTLPNKYISSVWRPRFLQPCPKLFGALVYSHVESNVAYRNISCVLPIRPPSLCAGRILLAALAGVTEVTCRFWSPLVLKQRERM